MEIFRLILFTPRPGMNYPEGGSWDTGATYGGCSKANTAACDPQQFNTLQDAVNYAHAHNETPVRMSTEAEVWAVLDGQKPITDDMIVTDGGFSLAGMSPLTLGVIALGAVVVLPRLFGGRRAA